VALAEQALTVVDGNLLGVAYHHDQLIYVEKWISLGFAIKTGCLSDLPPKHVYSTC